MISDFPMWLQSLSKGALYYYREPLSSMRIHPGQSQKESATQITSLVCWGIEIDYAWERKIFLAGEDDYRTALISWLHFALYILRGMSRQQSSRLDTDVFYGFIRKYMSVLID